MYLGFFFVHWSNTETKPVWQSEPKTIDDVCPFCQQKSDVIYKIYNTKTKHYSAFSIGKGNFTASFTCRNCTSEGGLEKEFESYLINSYLTQQEYEKILTIHHSNPQKAEKKLEKLLKKSNKKKITSNNIKETLNSWQNKVT